MEPKLNLIFFNLFGQKYVKKFKFLDIIRDIEIGNIQLPLPEKVWKHGKDIVSTANSLGVTGWSRSPCRLNSRVIFVSTKSEPE